MLKERLATLEKPLTSINEGGGFFLPSETYPKAYIIQEGNRREDGVPYFIAELAHNHASCDPLSNCSGTVMKTFYRGQLGTQNSMCRDCKSEVSVCIPALEFALNIH